MDIFKTLVVDIISGNVEFEKEKLEGLIEIPPNSELGDYAFPCFQLSKVMRKSPNIIAQELKDKIKLPEAIERVENVGGYLNFFVNRSIFIKKILEEVQCNNDYYGSSMQGKGKSALVEHTSINPNASPHVGRARNALIGDTVVRLMRFEGYNTDVHYFVNDIGKQISMLLLGARQKQNITFKDLLDIYVDINNQIKENPQLEKEVFELLYKLESADESTIKGFRNLVDICIEGQSQILNEIGIFYDAYDYESEYILKRRTDEILEQLKNTGKLFEDTEGRYVLNLEEYNLSYLVVTRADKTSLYPLRDIAYTIDKAKSNSNRNIIVLGEDQKLYFQQVKAAVNLLGFEAPEVIHYSFILLTEGKMSTRNGTVVLLEDLMQEAVSKAKEEILKRHDEIDENTAKSIAYGAVKYAILKVSNERNVIFDWESALSFEGDSAPYLQYSYARICSIIRKYNKKLPNEINSHLLKTNIEFELVKEISNFSNIIQRTLHELSPHIIANYVYSLTKKFSAFYHECPVLNAESEELKEARLNLINSVRQVIKNSLNLLGINEVEVM